MDFFEVVHKRRSIRRFTSEKFPMEKVERALDAAQLAPNSSNVQTWDFYWIQSPEMKKQVDKICLNQSAARTSSGIVVFTADPKKWRRSYQPLNQWAQKAQAPKNVQQYYSQLIPILYRWGVFNSWGILKWLLGFLTGLVRPIMRGPATRRDLQEVAIKSAALAAENFVLAITAQGGATCMMEGFDEWRMKRLLKLSCSARVVVAVAYGFEADRGTWGPQFRLPTNEVIHKL